MTRSRAMTEQHRQQAGHDDGDCHGFGPHALDGPSRMAASSVCFVVRRAGCQAVLVGVFQVDQHHHPNSAATPDSAMKPTAVATEIACPSAQISQKPQ